MKIEKKIPLFATTQSVCCYVDSDDEANGNVENVASVENPEKNQSHLSLVSSLHQPSKNSQFFTKKIPPIFHLNSNVTIANHFKEQLKKRI